MTGRSAPLATVREGEFAAMPLSVSGVDVTGLTITTSRTGRLRGRVVLNGQTYQPRPGAKVGLAAAPTGPTSFAAGPTGLLVEKDGTFDIGGVLGPFVLRMRGLPGGLTLNRVELGGVDVTDQGVTIGPNEEVSDIEVVLSSNSPVLVGQVAGAEGGCTVIVFSDDPRRWSYPVTRYVVSVRPEPDGSFRVDGLPAGRYFAIAVARVEPGQWLDPDYLKSLADRASSVSLKDGERQTLTLPLQR